MIARFQAIAAILFALFLSGALMLAWRSASWTWALVPFFMLFGIQAAVLASELLLQRAVNRRRGENSIHLRSIPLLVWREAMAGLRIFGWEQPFRSNAIPDQVGTTAGQAGVILIHGFFCTRGVWNSWMSALRHCGVPFIAVDLAPPFCSIDDYTAIIDAAVRDMSRSTGLLPVVVGHSMGGIAARAWLDSFDADARVRHVVTIGSPHQGTLLSRFSRSINARQMALGSSWLAALAAREPAARTSRITCFHSDGDNVVVPWTSARLPGADNRWIPGRTHLDLLGSPQIFIEVLHLVGVTGSGKRDEGASSSPG